MSLSNTPIDPGYETGTAGGLFEGLRTAGRVLEAAGTAIMTGSVVVDVLPDGEADALGALGLGLGLTYVLIGAGISRVQQQAPPDSIAPKATEVAERQSTTQSTTLMTTTIATLHNAQVNRAVDRGKISPLYAGQLIDRRGYSAGVPAV